MSEESKFNMSRRQFLGLTTGVVSVATLSALGVNKFITPNNREIDLNDITYKENETDVLVIGGGFAALFAAVKAHDAGAKVLMVSKGRLGTSGETPFAKGMFAYDSSKEKMSIDDFVKKVSISAIHTNNPVFTKQMAENSSARVAELREWGYFDGPLCHDAFYKPISARKIPLMERIMITHLIKEDGRIAGAAGFSIDEPTIHFFKAKSVILCTGAGGFKPSGFPICDLTHDGSAMAYRIGAKVTGKEWNDGHSGSTTNPADCYNGWHDMFDRTPGTETIDVHHDLGMDVNYQAYILGNPVTMMPGQEGKTVEGGPYRPSGFNDSPQGGPGGPGDSNDKKGPPPGGPSGSDDKKGPPPGGAMGASSGGASAGMAIHKSEGLVPINEKCASTITGLYAAGDALGSYMAGAIYTQVGSSSSGSTVQGAIAGEAAAKYSQGVSLPSISQSTRSKIKEEIIAPLQRDAGYSPEWVTHTLQGIMIPNFVLYIKKEKIMQAALAYIEELRDHHSPMLRAANLHELRLAHETSNMILNAEMKLRASIMRTESRCSHYRLDYPKVDYKNWEAWINIYQGADGTMKLEKQPFASWPN
jgi:succinate dehydrogenase/fumarate reductase flavoprotein subunit